MYKKVNVVMLPTNEKAPIGNNVIILCDTNEPLRYGKKVIEPFDIYAPEQHLYITSTDEIKENTNTFKEGLNGDWFYNTKYKTIANNGDITPFDFKIIATTDSSLKVITSKTGYTVSRGPLFTIEESLPQIPQQFIEHYVSEYNKGNIITEVMVEFERFKERHGDGRQFFMSERLKINQDNTINIRTVKGSWSKSELESLLFDFAEYITEQPKKYIENTEKYINKNL